MSTVELDGMNNLVFPSRTFPTSLCRAVKGREREEGAWLPPYL